MRKSTLALCTALLAVGAATAAVQPEAGKYYLIEAGRPAGYGTYLTDTELGGEGSLIRTDEVTTNNVWYVAAGSASTAITIQNYETKGYLFADAGGINVTSEDAVDLYLFENTENGGENAFGLALEDDADSGEFLNAYNHQAGTTVWSNDAGSAWFFTAIDTTSQTVEEAVAAIAAEIKAEQAAEALSSILEELNSYVTNIPEIASTITEGITKVNALDAATLSITELTEQAQAILDETLENGAKAAMEFYNGKTVNLVNVRLYTVKHDEDDAEAAYGVSEETSTQPYPYTGWCVAAGATPTTLNDGQAALQPESCYTTVEDGADAKAQFDVTYTNGHITLYNKATDSYIGSPEDTATSQYVPAASSSADAGHYELVLNRGNYAILDTDTELYLFFNYRGWHRLAEIGISDPKTQWDIVDVNSDAINSIYVEPTTAKATGIYDLAGRKVSKAQRGFYIINGQKTIVK
jgi:hypothetical protein